MTRAAAMFVAAIAFVSATSGVAFAQVPGPASPGRVDERFKSPPKALASPEIEIPGPSAPMPPAAAAKIHFPLTAVTFEGNTVFTDADLAPLTQPLVGKDISLADVFALRDSVTAKYRAAGFILSQAIVPPQKIVGGVVHIRIVEGYVDHVSFQGDGADTRGLIQEMANEITVSRPLDVQQLERFVLLISDIPGITIRTVIQPSKSTPGAAELIVILNHRTVSGSAEIDNRGSVAIGPEQGQTELDLNSLLGLDEQTSVLVATTGQPKDLQYAQLSSTWLLDDEGTRFKLSGSYSDTKPGGAIALLDAQGHTVTARGLFDYPLIRSRSENLRVGAEFSYLNSTTDLLGLRFSDDRLRYLTLSATYDIADTLIDDEPATNIVTAEFSQGLDILDASHNGSLGLSRANGRSDFTLVTLDATRTQTIRDRLSIAFSLSGQLAGSALLTPVQFGLGGSRYGRGYEPSELTGDDGIAGSVEGRYDLPALFDPIDSPQLYAFYDVGQIWNIGASPGTPSSASLASAGGGIRFVLLNHFNIDFELAKPLTRPIASRGNKNVRPLFNVSTSF